MRLACGAALCRATRADGDRASHTSLRSALRAVTVSSPQLSERPRDGAAARPSSVTAVRGSREFSRRVVAAVASVTAASHESALVRRRRESDVTSEAQAMGAHSSDQSVHERPPILNAEARSRTPDQPRNCHKHRHILDEGSDLEIR